MNPQKTIRWCAVCLLFVLWAGAALAADVDVIRQPRQFDPAVATDGATLNEVERADYLGTVRIYIVEPDSRWWDYAAVYYKFGFLDWGLVEAITVPDNGVWRRDVLWDATAAGWSSVGETNIQATVAIFKSSGYTADAYPPNGYWFTAHDADASAAAAPGEIGRNTTDGGYTHTVFVEQGSATW